MRTRSRTLTLSSVSWPAGSASVTHYSNSHSPTVYNETLAYGAVSSYGTEAVDEKIVDGLGDKLQHACVHWKESGKTSPLPNIMANGAPYPGYIHASSHPSYYHSSLRPGILAWDAWNHNTNTIPRAAMTWPAENDQLVLAKLKQRAVGSIADHMLNVCEADDIPRAIRSFGVNLKRFGYANNWRDLRRMITPFIRNTSPLSYARNRLLNRANGGRAVKFASGAYLAYQFGVAPLLSDIRATLSGGARLRAALQQYKNRQVSRISSTYKGDLMYDDSPTAIPYVGGPSTRTYRTYIPYIIPQVRYTLVFRRNNPYRTDIFQRLDNLLSRFGSNGPAGLAWELVPFSFVVDWFIDMGALIDKMNNLVGYEPIETLAFWKTKQFKFEVLHDVETYRLDTYTPVGGVNRWMSKQYSYYERSLLSSSRLSVGSHDRFGKKQGLISAALAIQLVKAGSKRR